MTSILRLGTRSSGLALAQSDQVAEALRALGAKVELVPLSTPGDRERLPLTGRANEGIFVSSVREALIEGLIDLAVHSFKDVPTDVAEGLVIAAVPRREDPRDTVVSRGPDMLALASGARIGTCSARRAAWVHRVRPDLEVVAIRGNIDDRVQCLVDGDYDAIILAAAGLNRLRCATPAVHTIGVSDLVPAPAQGALAIECRNTDASTRLQVHILDHSDTHLASVAERAVLSTVDPTDGTPVGAVATVRTGALHLLADICEPDGSSRILVTARRSRPDDLVDAYSFGAEVGRELLRQRAFAGRAMAS